MSILGRIFGPVARFFSASPTGTYTLAELAMMAASSGGRESASGVNVTHQTAMMYGPWYRGRTLLSADTAKIPLTVYRRTGGGKVPDTRHPAYRLLRGDPNEIDTPFHFIETITGHAIVGGNGYAHIERDDGVTPSALLILPPEWVTPVRVDGVAWYMLQVPGESKPRKLPARDVLHIRGFGEDSLCGLSVVAYAAESLGLAVGQRKYSSVFFRNSGRPAVTLEVPTFMKDPAKLAMLHGWDRSYSGLDNAHRTAILDGGAKANVLSFNAEESQLIESRQFSIREVALFLGLPAHKISDVARTSFSSLEQENADYLNSSLDPWLCRWEGECRKKLLTEEEKANDTHVVQFERNAILRADLGSQTKYATASLGGHPWQTVNEVRGGFGLNPTDGGDELAAPLNMATPDAPADPAEDAGGNPPAEGRGTPPGGDEADARAALREALTAAASRIVRRVGAAACKASASPAKYMGWLDAARVENAAVAASAFAGLGVLARHLGGTPPDDPAASLLDLLHAEYSALADAATPGTLPAAVEALAARLGRETPGSCADATLGEDS